MLVLLQQGQLLQSNDKNNKFQVIQQAEILGKIRIEGGLIPKSTQSTLHNL